MVKFAQSALLFGILVDIPWLHRLIDLPMIVLSKAVDIVASIFSLSSVRSGLVHAMVHDKNIQRPSSS